jgi:small-conductance mechanosensitive channel
MVKLQAESNIRFLIEKHLYEADIVVAFPQRDVHMDASKPLNLRIINVDNDDLSATGK